MLRTDTHRSGMSVAPGCTGEAATCKSVIVYLVGGFGTSAASSSEVVPDAGVSVRQVQCQIAG